MKKDLHTTMTLEDLIQNVTVQGNVRLSVWKDDDELSVVYIQETGGLSNQKIIQPKLDYEVLYMFASTDGYLHIELGAPGE